MIEMRAQAQAAAIRIIAEALNGPHSDEAAKLAVAREVSFLVAILYRLVMYLKIHRWSTYLISYSITDIISFLFFFLSVHRHVFRHWTEE